MPADVTLETTQPISFCLSLWFPPSQNLVFNYLWNHVFQMQLRNFWGESKLQKVLFPYDSQLFNLLLFSPFSAFISSTLWYVMNQDDYSVSQLVLLLAHEQNIKIIIINSIIEVNMRNTLWDVWWFHLSSNSSILE